MNDARAAIEQRVRQFIGENYYVDDALHLASAGSLIGAGVIDSTGVLELVEFLESEYGIAIAEEEVTPENLETIERIASFVSQKQHK
jgi:acyl carrier protein